MIGLRIVDAIAEQSWLKWISETDQRVVKAIFAAGGPVGRQVENLLHGTVAGHPLHPLLTDIPVGAWTVAAICDLMELRGRADLAAGADAAIAIGLAGAVGAVSTGTADWKELDAKPLRVGWLHGALNISATVLYTVSLVLRRKGSRAAGRACAFAGYGLVILAGYLGGDLVFREQIGVTHAEPVWGKLTYAPVLDDVDLTEGDMRQVEVGDRTILLARQHGKLYALDNSCSHLGGPLSEGTLHEGCVECPWHGSRFNLADGAPLAGPAALPQPCFETRVRKGQIEVRATQ